MLHALALVADPNWAMRELMRRTIEAAGFMVLESENAQQLELSLRTSLFATVPGALLVISASLIDKAREGLLTLGKQRAALAFSPPHLILTYEFGARNVPRYDLGLLEMLFAVLVSVVFAATWKRRLPVGWYAAVLPIVYAPVRFGLDFLRLDDPAGGDLRYGSLTPAQWACIALFLGGLFLYSRVARQVLPVGPAARVA